MDTTTLAPPPVIGRDRVSGLGRTVRLVARKDLDIEFRTRVVVSQIAPFGVLVLVVFAFALDPDRGVLAQTAPGLFWVTVTLSSLTTGLRSFDLERESGALEAIRLAAADLRGVLLGKVAAACAQLVLVEAVLFVGILVLYDVQPADGILLVAVTAPATVAIAAISTFYAAVTSGLRARATAHPLLFLPTITPVLLGATRVWEAALGQPRADSWSWVALVTGFALVSLSLALLLVDPLLEEA